MKGTMEEYAFTLIACIVGGLVILLVLSALRPGGFLTEFFRAFISTIC